MTSKRVLIVDDESIVLQLYAYKLKEEFDISIAESGQQALQMLSADDSYAVIVSDMHMPAMSGAELLGVVQQKYPLITRIMLTGDDQQAIAIEAVNEGQVFRFLGKPCTADRLAIALRAGIEQHRLVSGEKELLENTLRGSVELLMDMMSVVKPLAFGRATRIKNLVEQLCRAAGTPAAWEVSLAAMLSQIGCLSLSDSTLEKLHAGDALSPREHADYRAHPEYGSQLIRRIPRLDRIAALIASQETPWKDLAATQGDAEHVERAVFLNVALGYDRLIQAGHRPHQAMEILRKRPDTYCPRVVDILSDLVESKLDETHEEIPLGELRVGMLLAKDIVQEGGMILVTAGQKITEVLLHQLHKRAKWIPHPICVVSESVEVACPESVAEEGVEKSISTLLQMSKEPGDLEQVQ